MICAAGFSRRKLRMRGLAALFGMAMLFGTPSHAQSVEDFESGSHTFGGTTLPFRLFIPKSYRVSEKYPLILFLHGAGERGNDNSKPVRDNLGALIFARGSNQAKHPAFILAPQCPAAPNQWVDVPWGNGNYAQDRTPISNELKNVVALLDSMLRKFSIDTNRLYAVGSSMGGFGTWDIVTRYPGKFAATIPVVGAGDPSKMGFIEHMGIWAHHGDADAAVPVSGSRNMMKALESGGSTLYFTNCDFRGCQGPPRSKVEDTVAGRNSPRHAYSEYKGPRSWPLVFGLFPVRRDHRLAFLFPQAGCGDRDSRLGPGPGKPHPLGKGSDKFLHDLAGRRTTGKASFDVYTRKRIFQELGRTREE